MFKKLFDPDNALMQTFSQIADCVFLSLFWFMGCLPVVTIGASFAALYDATFRAFRRGERHSWGRFLKVYKDNWKGGILPTLVVLAVFFAGAKGMIVAWNAAVAGTLGWAAFAAIAVAGAVVLGILSVCFPMLSRFENSTAALLKNTVLLSLANLPRTLLLGLLNAGSMYLCLRWIFPVFFLPSLAVLIGSLLIEPMFKPYMPEESDSE